MKLYYLIFLRFIIYILCFFNQANSEECSSECSKSQANSEECSSECSKRMSGVTVSDPILAEQAKKLAHPLSGDKHKGQAGRIGVVGGSVEFTGAPYFASIASLRTGADLSYVFTIKDAAPVIKSYSPELMVLPYLDDAQEGISKIKPWLDRLHVVLLGPGLGRLDSTKKIFEELINILRTKQKPIIIDADGLYFVSLNPQILKNYPVPIILTPNKMEFKRLAGIDQHLEPNKTKLDEIQNFLDMIGPNGTIFCKDEFDEILHGGKSIKISGGGSGRRCGGQGDLMGGAMATFLAWALEKNMEPSVACYAASKLTRDCNAKAFCKVGRGMVVTDMIHEIPSVFNHNFELKS